MRSLHWLIPIFILAAMGSALAWLILSKTPAVEAAPTAEDAAVETPGAGAVIPPAVPAPGTSTQFDEDVEQALAIANGRPHGHAWCFPCQRALCVRSAADVVAHLRSHAAGPAQVADFEAWEHELQESS